MSIKTPRLNMQNRSDGSRSRSNSRSPSVASIESFPLGLINESRTPTSALTQDLQLVENKILEFQMKMNLSTMPSPKILPGIGISSKYDNSSVTGLRAGFSNGDTTEDRYNYLQRLIERITELDRLVLKNTLYLDEPASTVRRKQGYDLAALPMHMQIIDRLVDLHAHYRRPVVDHSEYLPITSRGVSGEQALRVNGESTGSPRIVNIQSESASLDKIDRLTKLLDESERKRKSVEMENIKLKKHMMVLQGEVSSLLQKDDPVQSVEHISAIEELRLVNERHQQCLKSMQAMLTKRAAVAEDTSNQLSIDYNSYQLTDSIREAMIHLDYSLNKRFDEYNRELKELKGVNEAFALELKENRKEQNQFLVDILTKDKDYESLKNAFDNLEAKSIDAQRSYTAESNQRIMMLNDELRSARTTIASMEQQTIDLSNQLAGMSDLILSSEQDKIATTALVRQLRDEVEAYQRLNQSLKDKIRSSSGNDGKEFLDTFEEVMRDEMMVMKAAFEQKLRRAREEADELSKKHLVEIARMKNSHSGFLPTVSSSQSAKAAK